MADVIDLMKKASEDPKAFKAILADRDKLAEYDLTSAELDTVKKMDPAAVKAIADRIGKRAMEGSQACQACADRGMKQMQPIQE